MSNWIGDNRWNSILTLLNEKRVAMGFSPISHTFSDWVKQSDINCLRDGLIEILPSYGYTLATALTAAGYGYSTWKTWAFNWIAEVSLDEIEDILNILAGATQISVHCHNPEGKEINSIDGMATIDYAVIYTKLHSSPTWINQGYAARNAGEHPKNIVLATGLYDVKIIFNGITSEQDSITVSGTVLLTFNFTRIETFDLVNWLDNCNIDNDVYFNESMDVPIHTRWDETHPFSLTNGFTKGGLGVSLFADNNINVSVNSSAHSEFTSEIFKRNLSENIVVIGGTYSSPSYVWTYATWYSINHVINIPIQLFNYWYTGNLGHFHYPSLQIGSPTKMIVDISDSSSYYLNKISAKSLYTNLRQFRCGNGDDSKNLPTTPGSFYWEDNSGTLTDFYFSSIPYDITGTAI